MKKKPTCKTCGGSHRINESYNDSLKILKFDCCPDCCHPQPTDGLEYYVSVELVEEESPLETEVMQRKNFFCKDYKDALAMFKFITSKSKKDGQE